MLQSLDQDGDGVISCKEYERPEVYSLPPGVEPTCEPKAEIVNLMMKVDLQANLPKTDVNTKNRKMSGFM
jgi:hypothetical protein